MGHKWTHDVSDVGRNNGIPKIWALLACDLRISKINSVKPKMRHNMGTIWAQFGHNLGFNGDKVKA